jgi:quinol monooxygenase YgiN
VTRPISFPPIDSLSEAALGCSENGPKQIRAVAIGALEEGRIVESGARRSVVRFVAVVALLLSLPCIGFAEEVIRISSYKARFGRNAEISKVTDEEITGVYAGMKGLKWVKFYFDPTSGERGSVTLWADRADLDAYMKSDARKGILAKLRPLIEGEVTSRIYVVYHPGSSKPSEGSPRSRVSPNPAR